MTDPVYGFQSINVEAQLRSPFSLLNWVKRWIAIRKRLRVFGRGALEFLEPQNRKVLVYVRTYRNETVLAVANLSATVQPVAIDLSRFAGCVPIELVDGTTFPTIGEEPYFLSLGPYGFLGFHLCPGRVAQR